MWLVPLNSVANPSFQLYCFPYGGAGPSVFKKWAKEIGPQIALTGIQLPGRESRIKEPPFTQMKALVSSLMNIWQVSQDLPFAFFGHSIGALIAYELSLELDRQHFQKPKVLFTSGSRAPHLSEHPDPIHQLPDEEFIEAIRTLGGTPEAILQNETLMEVFLPILRADFNLFEDYKYQETSSLDIPIVACGGDQDDEVSATSIKAWEAHTEKEFQYKIFPGNHFYLEQEYPAIIQYFSDVFFNEKTKT